MIQNQRELQVQRSGFTEEEIMSSPRRKINAIADESRHEMMTLKSMLQSEGDVARLYKGRYEDVSKATSGSNPTSDNLVVALRERLDKETSYSSSREAKQTELMDQIEDLKSKWCQKSMR